MMTRRDELNPIFRNLPKWTICTISILSLPIFLFVGIAQGLWFGIESWMGELDAAANIED